MVAIGSRREFVWDELLIDGEQTTARHMVHNPIRKSIVMRHDKPWEGDGCDYYAIVYDPERALYRMYYNASEMLSNNGKTHSPTVQVCCIESRDGLTWERPSLGLREFNGSKDNNIVLDEAMFPGMAGIDNFYVIYDNNPAPAVPGRFKAVMKYSVRREDGTYAHRLHSLAGDDGYNFHYVGVVTDKGYFDTLNTIHWNEPAGKYFCYIRNFHVAAEAGGEIREINDRAAHVERNGSVRDIRVLSSEDFINWTEPEHLRFNGVEDFPLYTNCVAPYPGSPHMLVGFPSRYVERPAWTPGFKRLCGLEKRRQRSEISQRYGLTTTDCLFMCSRDGVNWHRYEEAFMRPGPEQPNNWVYGDCYPAVGLIITPSEIAGADDELSMYAFDNHWMGVPTDLARYTIRRDGFVSLHADIRPEKVVTKPFTFAGGRLNVNFSTSARGYMYIKLRALDGSGELCSDELFGDRVNREVDFDGELAAFAGREVCMEIEMCDADFYAFQFFA